jgi:cytochrome P450
MDGNGVRQATDLPANRPLVTLQWGLYAFAPSLSALRELRIWAHEKAFEDEVKDIDDPAPENDADAVRRKRDRRNREEARQAGEGSAAIARLQRVERELGFDTAIEHWKIALEDPGARMQGISQAIWTAIRKAHGGALRTPYGVLVCSKALVEQVFENAAGNYTVSGYNTRLDKCFGKIYLGRDDGDDYRKEADLANPAIMAVTLDDAFESARRHTAELLGEITDRLAAGADMAVEVRDLVDELLARFCREWFGLPDDTRVVAGGWHWRDQATCPGHFHSPSRYTFQPQPGAQAKTVGEDHGAVLKTKVLEFVRAVRTSEDKQGRLGKELFAGFADDERLASNLIGVMMGFLPTVDGNLRGALFEWVRDRSLWDHQVALRSLVGATLLEGALAVIRPRLAETMQLRPVPEVVWRTALRADTLGPLQLRAGDMLVVSIVSATQEDLLNERDDDPFVVFGGKRKPGPGDDKSKIPTHACPGYDMAIGVMLGFLAALMDTVSLRPAASSMALRIGKR